jgi:hypothetical protein
MYVFRVWEDIFYPKTVIENFQFSETENFDNLCFAIMLLHDEQEYYSLHAHSCVYSDVYLPEALLHIPNKTAVMRQFGRHRNHTIENLRRKYTDNYGRRRKKA